MIKKGLTILHFICFFWTKVFLYLGTLTKNVYLFSSSHTNTYCVLLNSEVNGFVKQLTKVSIYFVPCTCLIITTTAHYKNAFTCFVFTPLTL